MTREPSAIGEHRYLDDVVRVLLRPLLDKPYSERSGWSLSGWDVEQGISLYLEGHGRVLLVELDRRDESRSCTARTALFNVAARRHFTGGEPLDQMDRAIVERLVAMLERTERGIELPERPSSARRSLVREIRVDRVLVREGKGHYYINPYVGCTIGCPFCWAAERADYSRGLEGLPKLAWGRWADVKVNAAEVLREEVRRYEPGPVRFSPVVTDPYQPLERRYRVTRQCLEVLSESGFPPVILTRAARVVEDADLLAATPGAAVGMSIPTDDDSVRHKFEPGADPIDERLDALSRLRAAGVKTFAVVQPALPMDPERLVRKLAPIIDAVRIDSMQEFEGMAATYEEAGMPEAADPGFYPPIRRALVDGFRAAGVKLDELDDLGQLVAG